ncbi:Holliday junction ATP-dependent DNA helicase RuvA [uncultured Desulfobacterium sp.]|uniref:Holliday junction branch migration complex subunit RuvA n=1 Tax=uncultured Desulfobacterium sp. TaxID=201089 RepID=A0A445MRF2_9BACT|nr:Holliday junction ATP-dependent DNA helicase RuvA [uncultured Desulfobacterium sp.]
MIAHLHGVLLKKTTESVIIDIAGVGYEVFVPLSTFYKLPEETVEASLHIYTHVREDALSLFGFHTILEKDIFLMLISVSGIGPRLANNILSGMGPQDLLDAIARGDSVRLQAIPGLGKKTSERIVLELKERAVKVYGKKDVPAIHVAGVKEKRLFDDALSALVNLGYTVKTAKPALEKAASAVKETTLEALIRESLRILS